MHHEKTITVFHSVAEVVSNHNRGNLLLFYNFSCKLHNDLCRLRIKSSRMLLATGFLRKVFEIFESYQTPIDMIATSEVGVSMSIDNDAHLNDIVNELKKYGTVTVDTDMCIICVVGDLDWSNVGFETLATEAMKNIPVRMISYGGSNYNISFLIRERDKKQALQNLSNNLFEK